MASIYANHRNKRKHSHEKRVQLCHRICLAQQHIRHSYVFEHQYGCPDVTWKCSVGAWLLRKNVLKKWKYNNVLTFMWCTIIKWTTLSIPEEAAAFCNADERAIKPLFKAWACWTTWGSLCTAVNNSNAAIQLPQWLRALMYLLTDCVKKQKKEKKEQLILHSSWKSLKNQFEAKQRVKLSITLNNFLSTVQNLIAIPKHSHINNVKSKSKIETCKPRHFNGDKYC